MIQAFFRVMCLPIKISNFFSERHHKLYQPKILNGLSVYWLSVVI